MSQRTRGRWVPRMEAVGGAAQGLAMEVSWPAHRARRCLRGDSLPILPWCGPVLLGLKRGTRCVRCEVTRSRSHAEQLRGHEVTREATDFLGSYPLLVAWITRRSWPRSPSNGPGTSGGAETGFDTAPSSGAAGSRLAVGAHPCQPPEELERRFSSSLGTHRLCSVAIRRDAGISRSNRTPGPGAIPHTPAARPAPLRITASTVTPCTSVTNIKFC